MVFHRKKALAALLLGFLSALWVSAADSPLTPEVKLRLDTLRAGFDSYVLKKVTLPYEEGLARLSATAIPALKRENDNAASRKDLDTLIRIKSDLERLGKGKVLTDPAQPTPPAALASVYATYRAEHLRLQTVREASFADARQRYDKGLAALQDELTSQQNIDGAVHVKQLRTDLAAAGAETGLVVSTAASSAPPVPREWTYHTQPNVGSIATMAFEPDGTFIMPYKNLKTPYVGTWKASKQPGVYTLIYSNVDGMNNIPIELQITGDKGQMDWPNVGMRYLKAMPKGDSTQLAGQWTCHITQDGAALGLLTLHPDSRVMLKMRQEKEAWTGTWNDTDKTRVIRMSLENHPKTGTQPFEVILSGDTSALALPNAEKLILKYQGGVPSVVARTVPPNLPLVSGVPAEWTFHTRADTFSTAWLRLLPKGQMEWHDRKGVQICQWRRTAEGFEVDCPNQKPWIVKINAATAADVDRSAAGTGNGYLFPKTPLPED